MQPVSGGATPLAGASATLPRTSPNQANPTASQQYATLPLHASISKTEASESHTAVKMGKAPSAASQSSIPAYASALDDPVTHSVQTNASTAKYEALHTHSTVINQGSYSTAVPATVHYAVQVPNYGIPPLLQPAPPPLPSNVSFPSQSHAGHFPSSIPPLPQTAQPPPSSVSFPSQSHAEHFPSSIPPLSQTAAPPPNVSFPSQSHTGHFSSSIPTLPQTASLPPLSLSLNSFADHPHTSHFPPSIPVPNYSTYPVQTNEANEGNALNSLPVGYNAAGSVPGTRSSVNFSSAEGAGPPQSYRLYNQYSTLPLSTTTSSAEDVPQQSHTPHGQYATLPPSTIPLSIKGDVPFSSHTPYSQYATLPTSTTTSSTEQTVPQQSHTAYSQYSTLPSSTTTVSTEQIVSPPSQKPYSQSSTGPPSTTFSVSEIATLPRARSLYSQYSALPPATSTSFSDETIQPSSHVLYSQYWTLPPSATTHEADVYSSIEDILDPIARSRKPNARLSGKKIDPVEVGL